MTVKAQASVSAGMSVILSLPDGQSTAASAISTDTLILTSVRTANFVSTGSQSVTIYGARAGRFSCTLRVRLHRSAGESSEWVSESAIAVKTPHLYEASWPLIVTGPSHRWTLTNAWTTDSPELSSVVRQNFGR